MPVHNTRQKLDGSGPFGFACRRISRGAKAGQFRISYSIAQREGPACRSHPVRSTVGEEEARSFCEECWIPFPEPPPPKPLALAATGLLARMPVGKWVLPYGISAHIRRPTFLCGQLFKKGLLERRWRGGIQPTQAQLLDLSWDVKDFYDYRLSLPTILALRSSDVLQGTRTGWCGPWRKMVHFYVAGVRLCDPAGLPEGIYRYPADSPSCPVCARLHALPPPAV